MAGNYIAADAGQVPMFGGYPWFGELPTPGRVEVRFYQDHWWVLRPGDMTGYRTPRRAQALSLAHELARKGEAPWWDRMTSRLPWILLPTTRATFPSDWHVLRGLVAAFEQRWPYVPDWAVTREPDGGLTVHSTSEAMQLVVTSSQARIERSRSAHEALKEQVRRIRTIGRELGL
jgi:hypothetical protein